jgi:serine/threonine protein kinase
VLFVGFVQHRERKNPAIMDVVPEWLRAVLWLGLAYLLVCAAGLYSQRKRERARLQVHAAIAAATQLDDSGRYRVIGEIGQGGYAVVYKAEDLRTGAIVAMKVSHTDKQRQAVLRREYDVMLQVTQQRVGHDLFPRPLSLTHLNKVAAFSMEYTPRSTLESSLTRITTAAQVEHIALAILRSVAYLHSLGYGHGDLKPSNILVSPALNAIKLIDFGLTRRTTAMPLPSSATATAQRFHAVSYRAPELILWRQNSYAADMWALGGLFGLLLSRDPERPGPMYTAEDPALAKLSPCEQDAGNELLQLETLLSRLGHPGPDFCSAVPFVEPLHHTEWERLEAAFPSPLSRARRLEHIRERTRPVRPDIHSIIEHAALLELLTDLLQWKPQQRPTAIEAVAFLQERQRA